MDEKEKAFRQIHGDELTEKILLHTSQIYDLPFELKVQTAMWDDPDISYQVALKEASL